MPQRFLKPGIVTSLRLARCSPWAQLLFYKLLNLVDDYGRYDAHPLVLGRAAFPYGDHNGRNIREDQIEDMLGELESASLNGHDEPCLYRYTAEGKQCLVLARWTERLKASNGKLPGSRYPSPEKVVGVWEKLSEDMKRRQRLSSTSSSSASSSTTTTTTQRNCHALDLKTQFAAARQLIQQLEAIPEDDRTREQEQELKKNRAVLVEVQKKQAAGQFSPAKEEAA